jgi:two-component system, cell cycle response regulator
MDLEGGLGRRMRIFWAVAAAALAAFAAHAALGFGGDAADRLLGDYVYHGLMVAAAAACLARAAAIREERAVWLAMGLGLASWTAAELYWALVLADEASPPYPSFADALWLAYYPASYVTVVLLLRSRVDAFRPSLWLDGAIAALAVGALAAALALQPIVDTSSGDTAAVATNLAYPLGDLVLLVLVVGASGVSGWRVSRTWLLIGTGLALGAVADGVYLVQFANGTYVEGKLLDVLWPASALLVAFAAWQPRRPGTTPEISGWRVVGIPFACALIALGLLVHDHHSRLNLGALLLTAATLLLVIVRMGMAFRENQRMLARSREEACTDALTGLRNRRSLMADLELELAQATPEEPRALVLFDLDGFKEYNDAFGHPAGDGLLVRLGLRLADTVRGHGLAYRLGGDEFCVLLRPGAAGVEPLVAACVAALSERGEGFDVTTSYGAVVEPDEAGSAIEALQLADRRMYARKGGRRMSAGRQSRDVLLRVLSERQPELHAHLRETAELALATARELGMGPEELDEVTRAAELHDLGKIAIPDDILTKPGPLDETEWSFMRRHTMIGERILLAAPALRSVARLVRSSHERWDGGGYPDGLAGEQIPLGARVVAVCDAFHAMTSERPYRPTLSAAEALAELRRCAGSHFDAAVVDAFGRVLERGRRDQAPARA